MQRLVLSSFLSALLVTALGIALLQVSEAQVRSSTNFQLQSDSINFGGGLSTSTNFTQESTAGEVATGVGTSTNYQLRAGYQQMQEVFLSLSAAADVAMSPELPGLTGGTSNGSTSVTVITDSPSGYSLSIESEGQPAMQDGANSIADLASSSPALFNFTTAGVQEAALGFSPSGVDIVARYLDNGATCGSGSDTPLRCWNGLSTSSEVIALSTDGNQPNGATTTINFRVVVDAGANIPAGTYVATSTLTALPL